MAKGAGRLRIRPTVRPSINVISVLASLNAGSAPRPGCYRTRIRLVGGNTATQYVGVPTRDACSAD